MKKLPKIYQGEFTKKINNNKNNCYLDLNEKTIKQPQANTTILETITEIFSSLGHAYNIPVTITTKDQVYETSLIAKTKKYVVTLDNETIPIEDIITIEKNI